MTRFAFANQMLKELRDSRLWPLALALGVALVAIPIVLSKPAKSPSTTGATSTPASTASALAELKPIVTVSSATAQSERKSVTRLSRKNPFTPLAQVQDQSVGGSAPGGLSATASVGATGGAGTAATTGSTGTAGSTTGSLGSTGGGSTGGGSTGSTGSSGGSTGGGSTTFYYTYVADVTFGEMGKTKQHDVRQLRALPSSDLPVVVFMGATSEGDTAVFLVGSGAAVTGEGKCKPSDEDCVFLYLKPDETASIAVGDATGALTTYELKLREIKVKKLEQPPSASSASTGKASKKASASRSRRTGRARAKGFFQLFGQLGF